MERELLTREDLRSIVMNLPESVIKKVFTNLCDENGIPYNYYEEIQVDEIILDDILEYLKACINLRLNKNG